MGKSFIGVDLGCSAASRQPSAVAVLDAARRLHEPPVHFKKASELVATLSAYDLGQVIVAVDAPRTVPDHTQENYAYRSCEKAIKSVDKGAGAFSGVTALFIRWYEIENRYFQGVKVIETYPRVVWKRLGLPGKPRDFPKHREEVWRGVGELVGASCEGFSLHQIDAVLCAYTAWCYANGRADWYGELGEGLIFIPAAGEGRPIPPGAERIDEPFQRFPSMSK